MVGFALAVAELFEECEEISCRLCHENAQSADFQGVSEISVLFGIGPRLSYPPGHTGGVNDDEKNQSDCQIIRFSNYQIGEPPSPKRGSKTSFQFASVRCSVGKEGYARVRRIGGGLGAPHWQPVGGLQVFGDVCSYLQMFAAKWHGGGGPRRRRGSSKLARSKVQGKSKIQGPI